MVQGSYIDLECQTGQISDLVDWGIVTKNEDNNECKRQEHDRCLPILEPDNLKNQFDSFCKTNKNCTLLDFTYFITGEGIGENRTFEGPKNVINDCTGSTSRLFIQYMCKQTEEELAVKNEIRDSNILIEIVSIVIVLIFMAYAHKAL